MNENIFTKYQCNTCEQTCESSCGTPECSWCQTPMIPESGQTEPAKSQGMTVEEAQAYLESRGLDSLVLGGASQIAKMQGIEKLRSR